MSPAINTDEGESSLDGRQFLYSTAWVRMSVRGGCFFWICPDAEMFISKERSGMNAREWFTKLSFDKVTLRV